MATTAVVTRYLELDAVRGFAVMGILAMNINAFALPDGAYFSPAAYGSDGPVDYAAWAIGFVLIDSKMRALFSMLFGASTALVIERAELSGMSGARVHYSRMIWLLIFGLLHFYFLWWGDILALYAQCGMLLYFFRNLSIPALRNWGIGLIAAGMVLWGGFYTMLFRTQMAVAAKGGDGEGSAFLTQMATDFGLTEASVAESLALFRGGYAGIVEHRLFDMTVMPFMGFVQAGLETLGIMLIGMALYRSGMLTGGWERARYRRWAWFCIAVAIPALCLIAAYMIADGFTVASIFGGYIVLSLPFDVTMAVGYAAALMLWIDSARNSAFMHRVAAAGRAAFSNYLGTSIVMTTIFYGYGLGLFGEVNRAALYLFCIAMWALMLIWSKPWLQRFRYGPLEWLWRSLARGRIQSMRISVA